jgi:hypothetical protein
MKIQLLTTLLFLFSFILNPSGELCAQSIDLSKAVIITSPSAKSLVRENTIKVLQEEMAKRTTIQLKQVSGWGSKIVIAMATVNDSAVYGQIVPLRKGIGLPERNKEGYRIFCSGHDGREVVWIIGADERGILFGVGKLLRTAEMTKNKILLNGLTDLATSPMQAIRGHQLGYRNTANSYDAWDVNQFEQYIREHAIFGSNSIECIPLGNDEKNVLMPIPPAEMNRRISEICARYDLDFWAWTPISADLKDKSKWQAELAEHENFYKNCPKLDEIFVPGGDPGDNHPREVLPFLKELHNRLIKYHPDAGIWISLQGFSAEKIDYFFSYLDKYSPDWIRGVVSGPGSPTISETRFRLPAKYKHRHYPDITHNVRCDYPVVNWDQAFMLTVGREGSNPMPNYYSKIHATYAPFTDGFISYSDGCHDDVNKITFSMRGWDMGQSPHDIMSDYCRFFFGPELAETGADGIFGLEQNWAGPIRANGSIETTFAFWQKLEKENPRLAGNWRWQLLVMRAYYDTYQRRRKIYEENLESEANKILARAKDIGPEKAMDQALEMVNRADTKPVSQDLYARIVGYCDDLFHTIGLQTDVQKYHAANSQRGCLLQFVNYPLNNRWWLADEFKKIRDLGSNEKKLERLEVIRTWENPGPGSYYDNVSNIETGPRVKTTVYDGVDVAWWNGGMSRERLSSQLFQNEPVLEYEDLDFNGKYLIRVCGYGDALIRVDGERLEPILYNKGIGEFKEFVVPDHLIRDGKIRVTFDRPEESNLRWSKYSHISYVWLIKKASVKL